MNKKILLSITLFLMIISCSYKFTLNVKPFDALIKINGEKAFNNKIFISKKGSIELECERTGYKSIKKSYKSSFFAGNKKIDINLEPEIYKVIVDVIDKKSEVIIEDKSYGLSPATADLSYGNHRMVLKRSGLPDQECIIEAKSNAKIKFKHHDKNLPVKPIGIFKCGRQPKQVIFSPDDKFIFIPLLDDYGFDVFDMNTMSMKKSVDVPVYDRQRGFPEGLFIEQKNTFLISQMTTGKVFEYSVDDLKLIRTMDTEGIWPKFMAKPNNHLDYFAVSNWESNDISIIDYKTGKVIKKIKTDPEPRGLVFDREDKYLYATTYLGGTILKINCTTWKIEKKIFYKQNAAMRHVLLTKDGKTLYVSNMHHAEVYEIDVESFKIVRSYKVDYNPNTIEFSPDERYIFSSCRGPNDEVSYLRRSPRNGLMSIIDLKEKRVLPQFEGGNQPTGLAISHDGNYLCFSNFRDDEFELYWIGDLPK